jgi:hypothetical protein
VQLFLSIKIFCVLYLIIIFSFHLHQYYLKIKSSWRVREGYPCALQGAHEWSGKVQTMVFEVTFETQINFITNLNFDSKNHFHPPILFFQSSHSL